MEHGHLQGETNYLKEIECKMDKPDLEVIRKYFAEKLEEQKRLLKRKCPDVKIATC